jgi:hypothetical protein
MSWLSDLLQGIPLNAVLKERVALAEQKFKDIEAENRALKERIAVLIAENDTLKRELEGKQAAEMAAAKRPTIKWGCYQFDGEQGLYCPACYDTKGKKHLTTRINSNLRRCSVCRTELGT